jgi:hypothetical protein
MVLPEDCPFNSGLVQLNLFPLFQSAPKFFLRLFYRLFCPVWSRFLDGPQLHLDLHIKRSPTSGVPASLALKDDDSALWLSMVVT